MTVDLKVIACYYLYNKLQGDFMKYQILMQLFLMLLSNKRVTIKDIMARFELPRRTVFRYVDTLSVAGIPIISTYGRNGGYSIAPQFKIPAAFFTAEEFESLNSILDNAIDKNPTDKSAISIKEKLTALKR